MKIDITEPLLIAISAKVATATMHIVRDVTNEEDEKELIAALLRSTLTPKDRVLGYLQKTKKGVEVTPTEKTVTVGSEYLRKALDIGVLAMRQIRLALIKEVKLVEIETTPMRIVYSQAIELQPNKAMPAHGHKTQ